MNAGCRYQWQNIVMEDFATTHLRQILGAVITLFLKWMEPSRVLITWYRGSNAAGMSNLLPRWTWLIYTSKMLHRIHNNSGNTIVVPFDEVNAFLGTFREENVIGTINDGYSRNVSVIGRFETHHERLVVAWCLDVLQCTIHCLRTAERIANLSGCVIMKQTKFYSRLNTDE